MPEYVADPANDTRELEFRPADPTATRTLRPDDVERFNTNGFVAPLPVFDPAEADRVRDYIDDLLQRVVDAPDPRNSYSVISYHIVCQGLHDLVRTPRILDYVEDLLGPDFVCWGTHLFCKPPFDQKAVPFHQDAIYWPLTPSRSVTVWLAIDDADEENAAMQFIPGSHRLGPLPHETKELDGTRVLNRQAVDAERHGEPVSDELRAGHASIHSDLLLHGSRANSSPRRRAGLTIRYAAAEVGAVAGAEYFIIPAVHCRGTIPEWWPNCPRPLGEDPGAMASIWGDFDGTPPGGG